VGVVAGGVVGGAIDGTVARRVRAIMPAVDRAAEVIGSYRLLGTLSRGDQSTVFRAERVGARHLGRVAIKLLDPDAAAARVARLQHEAKVLASVSHPFVANVLDLGRRADGAMYLVTELVRGRPLSALRHEAGQVHVARAVSIAMQALAALARAHQVGVVHGAIDPDAVLVEPGLQETVKLIGFGRAQLKGEGAPEASELSAETGSYAAPERLRGSGFDARADLWSVAACLYEALAGVHPFAVHAKVPIASSIAAFAPPSLRALRPDVPESLEAVIARALEKEPARRFSTADDLIAALAPYGRSGAVHLPWRPPSSPRGLAVLVVPSPGDKHVIIVAPGPAPPSPSPFPPLTLRATVLAPPIAPRVVRSAALHGGATSAVAVTSVGLFTWSVDDGWIEVRSVGDVRTMRGVAVSPGGDGLVFGENGLAVLLPRGGPARSLGASDTMRVNAACVVDEGHAVLGGFAGAGAAARSVLVEVRGDDLRERPVDAPSRIDVIAAAGDAFVACGADGLYVLLHGGVAMTRRCGIHDLRGIAVDADGSGVVVGQRGVMLAFGADGQPATAAEHLGVSADLTCACATGNVLWVAGDGIVLRRNERGVWRSAPVHTAVCAMVAEPDRACLLFDDGAVHEVRVE
jgi:serine/threonine protein kinase